MKNFFTFLMILCFSAFAVQAQILNPSFEIWIDFGDYEDPENWNTPNEFTNNQDFGLSETLVTKDSVNFNTGSYSARLETKDIPTPLGNFNIPGVVTNGEINLGITEILGGEINFAELIIGGTPSTERFDKFTGFFRYEPAGTDTATFVAFIKKDGEVIGTAIHTHTGTQTSFEQFEADFFYTSCETPDTLLIIALSSSSTEGQNGTVLNVDDFDVSGVNTNTAPEANAAEFTIKVDSFVSFNLLDFTFDCDGDEVNIENVGQPSNGTLSDDGDGNYTYTPNAGFAGEDSFTYTVCDDGTPVLCNSNTVTITVEPGTGIFNQVIKADNFNVYPNPASDVLTFENKTRENVQAVIHISDITGRLVVQHEMNGIYTTVSVSEMANGIYFFNVISTEGEVLSNGRFAVSN